MSLARRLARLRDATFRFPPHPGPCLCAGGQRGATGHSGVPGLAPAGAARTRLHARRAAEGSRAHVGDAFSCMVSSVTAAREKDEP